MVSPLQFKTDRGEVLFKDIPKSIAAGRYHSWILDRKSLPGCFGITAEDNSGQFMAIRHKRHNLAWVQLHPESLIAEFGNNMIKNWLES